MKKTSAVVAVAAVYYGLARVGLEWALAGTPSPAAGFALAGAIALGPEACVGVFLGSWLANLHSLPGLHAVSPPMAAIVCAGVSLGCALQALAGARLLKGELGSPDPLSRSRDVVRFAALTSLICLLGANLAVCSLVASGLVGKELFARTWLTWWIGDVVGVMIIAPLLFAWRQRSCDEFGEPPSPRRALAILFSLALMSLSVWLGFGDLFPPSTRYPLSLLPFAALIWITLRRDIRGATIGAAALAALVQWQTGRGLGLFALEREIGASFLLATVYAGAAALTAFLLRALLSEHRSAFAHLEENRAALERRISEQCRHINSANAQLRDKTLGDRETERCAQLYRRIVSELPIAIAVLRIDNPHDPESWIIEEFNPAGRRLVCAGGENPAGKRLFEFSPDIRGTDFLPACAEALRLNHGVDFVGPDHMSAGRFSIRVFPLGAPFIAISFEDIMTRKTAEEAPALADSELKDQFLRTMAHELRTPLSVIKAVVANLRDHLAGPMTPEQTTMVATADRHINRLTRLLNNFFDLTSLESRHAHISRRPIDPCALISDACEGMRLAHRGRPMALLCDIPKTLPSVRVDAEMIAQVLGNLLDNALRNARSRVTVRAAATDDAVEVSITDDGPGIPTGELAELFNKFVQLDRPKGGSDYKGTGLGLAISKEIMTLNEGRIWADNAPGLRGACFRFTLPLTSKSSGRLREEESHAQTNS
ncbi:MAG: ATP-binding protein [Elusimicrobiota bacterium]